MSSESHHSGAIIVLPDGGAPGGVTTWARTTAAALARIGWHVAIVGPRISQAAWSPARFVVDAKPTIAGISDGVLQASNTLRDRYDDRVVALPQLSGAAYAGTVAGMHRAGHPNSGIIGWMHTDIRHDIELIRRFLPCLGRVVCVSRSAEHALAAAGVCQAGLSVVVPTASDMEFDDGNSRRPATGPLQLLYVGRVESFQKRALCLPAIVADLQRRGCPSEMTVVGDGPARPQLRELVRSMGLEGAIRLRGMLPCDAIAAAYATHDLLVQPSRSEGLGLARIEAAMHGCVPVVTPGGSAEGITHAVDGLVVAIPPDADDPATASAFADAIAPISRHELGAFSQAARQSSRATFAVGPYAGALDQILARASASHAVRSAWASIAQDPDRAAAFTVPDDLLERIRASRSGLVGRPIVLHGAGAHTSAAWGPLMDAGVDIVAITDDDPQRWGDHLHGVPIVAPEHVPSNAHAVLLSTWLHEDALWARRRFYEERGLEVVRLYAKPEAASTG
ncbi:MAG: glycosyltransferase family 4 protein [Planctomycetota bacterium]